MNYFLTCLIIFLVFMYYIEKGEENKLTAFIGYPSTVLVREDGIKTITWETKSQYCIAAVKGTKVSEMVYTSQPICKDL